MRKSKYLGLVSGEWECTHVGVDCVQPAFLKKRDNYGNRVRSKYPGHQVYYYIFERPTSDGKAMKMIRLNATQARRVWTGKSTVEEIALMKEQLRTQAFKNKVSYSFCD